MTYALTTLLPPGAAVSSGSAINNVGQVAVQADEFAYVYTNGTPQELSRDYAGDSSVGPANHTTVLAMNDHGQLLGWLTYPWTPAKMSMFNFVQWMTHADAPQYAIYLGVGDDHAVVTDTGVAMLSGYNSRYGASTRVFPAGAIPQPVSDVDVYVGLSEQLQAIGETAHPTANTHAYVREADGTTVVLPALTADQASTVGGISHDGTVIVGTSMVGNGPASSPVYWDSTRAIHPMSGAPAGFQPTAVNNSGMVVGTLDKVAGIWWKGRFAYLNQVATAPGGLPVCLPKGINDTGQIVASLCAPGTENPQKAVMLTPKL